MTARKIERKVSRKKIQYDRKRENERKLRKSKEMERKENSKQIEKERERERDKRELALMSVGARHQYRRVARTREKRTRETVE